MSVSTDDDKTTDDKPEVESESDLEIKAAENLKRVLRPAPADHDWYADPGITRMTTLLETKTVWHPKGV